MTRRIEFTVADEIGEVYDAARGDVPMAAWIKRALESALGNPSVEQRQDPVAPVPVVDSGLKDPASSRASKQKPSLADTWRR